LCILMANAKGNSNSSDKIVFIIQCCTEKRTSNSIELFHGGMQRNYNKSEDFLTQCYLQKLRNVDCQKLSMGNWRELLNIRRNMQC
jgi:hypothetical protein